MSPQCTFKHEEWLCQPSQVTSANGTDSNSILIVAHLRAHAAHRALQQEKPATERASVHTPHRSPSRTSRVDQYNPRESIRLLNALLNNNCESYGACSGQV